MSYGRSAGLGPPYDPLRPAEDIAAVPGLSNGGRAVTVAGVGCRPEEYAMSGAGTS